MTRESNQRTRNASFLFLGKPVVGEVLQNSADAALGDKVGVH
jgi:hypothetical protein